MLVLGGHTLKGNIIYSNARHTYTHTPSNLIFFLCRINAPSRHFLLAGFILHNGNEERWAIFHNNENWFVIEKCGGGSMLTVDINLYIQWQRLIMSWNCDKMYRKMKENKLRNIVARDPLKWSVIDWLVIIFGLSSTSENSIDQGCLGRYGIQELQELCGWTKVAKNVWQRSKIQKKNPEFIQWNFHLADTLYFVFNVFNLARNKNF